MSETNESARRFARQIAFAPFGAAGQARLERARVLLVGCGALGGTLAQTFVRCGVGALSIVDRDVVDLTNLPRQVLFEERHLGLPKVDAARESLGRIGGPTKIETYAEHLDGDNLEDIGEECDLVLDGTDNLATRYLINDFSVEREIPWAYGGVVGSGGIALFVLPGRGPCLRCLFPEPPPPGTLATCESAGILLPAVSAIASFQAGAALRWLAGDERARAAFEPALVELDPWDQHVRRLTASRDPECPCCVGRELRFLHAPVQRTAISLCGRNTVQVRPALRSGARPDLAQIAARARASAQSVHERDALVSFDVETFRVTVFPDGRALIEGTDDLGRARAVYDRFVGS